MIRNFIINHHPNYCYCQIIFPLSITGHHAALNLPVSFLAIMYLLKDDISMVVILVVVLVTDKRTITFEI